MLTPLSNTVIKNQFANITLYATDLRSTNDKRTHVGREVCDKQIQRKRAVHCMRRKTKKSGHPTNRPRAYNRRALFGTPSSTDMSWVNSTREGN